MKYTSSSNVSNPFDHVAGKADNWEREYDTSDVYAIDELRPSKLFELTKAFKDRSNELFRHYLMYNSVMWAGNTECNETCHLRHICTIDQLDFDNYDVCMSGGKTTVAPPKTTHHPHHGSTPLPVVPSYLYYLVGGLAVAVFALFLVVAFMCLKRGGRLRAPRYSKFGSLSING